MDGKELDRGTLVGISSGRARPSLAVGVRVR